MSPEQTSESRTGVTYQHLPFKGTTNSKTTSHKKHVTSGSHPLPHYFWRFPIRSISRWDEFNPNFVGVELSDPTTYAWTSSLHFRVHRWRTQTWWPLEDLSPASKNEAGLGYVQYSLNSGINYYDNGKTIIWRCISYQKWIHILNFHLVSE